MTGQSSGSIVIRQLIPSVIILPVVISALQLQGQRAGIYGAAFGTAMFTISIILILTRIIWFNARLLNRLDEQRKKNEALQFLQFEVSKVLAVSEDAGETISRTLEAICLNLNFEVASMWYVDKINCELYYGESWATLGKKFLHFQEACKQIKFTRGQGIIGITWSENRPLWVPDVTKDPDFKRIGLAVKAKLHMLICFPVKVAGEVIGVMEFFSTQVHEPDKDLLEVLNSIGATIGQAVSRKEAQALIIETARIKSEFTSIVSHELRTPLTVIKGSVDLLSNEMIGPITADQKAMLSATKNNVDRLTQLINNVLDYQSLDSKRMKFNMVESNLCDIVDQVANRFSSSIENKGLSMRCDIPPDPLNVLCDKDKIMQVLSNYLSNVVKFVDKGTITVKVNRSDGFVKVAVMDEGEGINDEDKQKLFKSFTQMGTLENHITGGAGLGLAISKKIIEVHEGSVGMDSVVGYGSTFYFMLKIKD